MTLQELELSSTIDDIRAAYTEEQRNKPKAIARQDVPGTYDAITTQWLTNVLCSEVAGAEVSEFTLDVRDDGSSNRRRLFLTYNETGTRAGLPRTIFCKAAENLSNRIMLGFAGTALGEVNFYNKIRHRLEIEAPVAYHAAFDPRNFAYTVVMKDIAGTVEFCDERTNIDWDRAVTLVRLLAELHGTFYEHPDLGKSAIPYAGWPDLWNNIVTNLVGYEDACDRAFAQAESLMPSRLFKQRAKIWPATVASVARHNVLPKTLIHGDVHLKNWYITTDNRMGLADWQLVSVGHWSRDFIYAVCTALSVEDRRAWLPELLSLYLERMAELGVPAISVDEAMLNCRQQLFTALAFWTSTLVPTSEMPAMQPDRTTFKFLERLTAAIDDLDALAAF